jgi:hypothetical protein
MFRHLAARPRPLRDGALHGLIAMVMAATALIWSPACLADAIYGGSTTQEGAALEAIVVRSDLPGGTVRSVVIAWEARCSDDTTQPFTGELKVSTETPGFGPPGGLLVLDSSEGGTFSAHSDSSQPRSDGGTLVTSTTLKGSLAGRSASGTLSGEVTITPGGGGAAITCTTGEISWLAARGPRVFGGASEQGEPVVARIRSRTRLSDLIFGWNVKSCSDGARVRFGDWLENVRLFRSRRVLRQSFRRDDGDSRYRYGISFRSTSRVARGTFSVTYTRTFTDGTPARTCSTGVVSWRGLSG